MANFYKCEDCGVLLLDIADEGLCDKAGLELLHPQIEGGNAKANRPSALEKDGKVIIQVGAPPHPMGEDDYIEWIYVQTSYGGVHCALHPGDDPAVKLNLNRDEVQEIYAYSKAGGLWKAKDPVFAPDFEQNSVACSPEFALGCVDMTQE